jgi:hypothetical protein
MTFDFTPPALRIAPVAEFAATGPAGGMFMPASGSYTVKNLAATPQAWSASSMWPWLTVTPSGGTLAPGETVTLQASFTPAANTLRDGVYKTLILFINKSTGESRTRLVRLRVGNADDCTEWFEDGDNDLDFKTITFTPSADGTSYSPCLSNDAANAFATNPSGSTPITLKDDETTKIDLTGGRQVFLYGQAYPSVYVGSNGNITFVAGDSTSEVSLDNHFSLPRISGLYDDLDPSAGGVISYKQLSDRFVVTYSNVYTYGTSLANSFQIELFFDKTIRMTWLNVSDFYGLVGLSAGEGVPVGYTESDFSAYLSCGTLPVAAALSSIAPNYTSLPLIPIAVTFAEPVTGFTQEDVSAANAVVSGFSGNGASYSFNLTPAAQGAVTATLPAGAALGADNRPTARASIVRVYDSLPPTITIGGPTPAATSSGPVAYTVLYAGADSITLADADVTLSCTSGNATGSFQVSGTGSTRTVTLKNISGQGQLVISLAEGTARDAAGNVAAATSPSLPLTVNPSLHPAADVNADSAINAMDVQLVINAALGRPTNGDVDVDHSGRVDAIDVQAVIKAVLERT